MSVEKKKKRMESWSPPEKNESVVVVRKKMKVRGRKLKTKKMK